MKIKWHRIIFWIAFALFFMITIAAEAGRVRLEGIVKFLLFTSSTIAGILIIDKLLIPKYLVRKNYLLFGISIIGATVYCVSIEFALEHLLLGAYPGKVSTKLLENCFLIAPWIFVALCLFIAEDYGRINLEKTKNELLYLKQQINPHFLLNTHNNIYFLIQQDPSLASSLLLKLSGIMKYMLYECTAEVVPLGKEFENLENYIALEKIRKNENLEIKWEPLPTNSAVAIPPLLLITFVENAFKHTSNFKNKLNFIHISGMIEGNILFFEVVNSKGNNSSSAGSGIGLKNVKQRLNLLFEGQHILDIKDNEETFSIKLTLHLK